MFVSSSLTIVLTKTYVRCLQVLSNSNIIKINWTFVLKELRFYD